MTRNTYTVNWYWPKNIEFWIYKNCIGTILNFPSGMSKLGYRIDIEPGVNPNLICDIFHHALIPQSWGTVICDPPFHFFAKWKWINMVADLAEKRFILSTPGTVLPQLKGFKKPKWYAIHTSGNFFIRHFLIFDRVNTKLI